MSQGKPRNLKFYISHNTFVWSIICCILCVIGYVFLECFYTANISDGSSPSIVLRAIETAKSLVVVIASIIGTSIVTGLLIETRGRNEIFVDTLFDTLSVEPSGHTKGREDLLHLLEKDIYFGGSKIKHDVYSGILSRVDKALMKTYSTKNSNHIVCSVYSDRIEKEIVHETWIRSYEDTLKESNFPFASQTVKYVDGVSKIEIQEISVNGKPVKPADYSLDDETISKRLDGKNGYSKQRTCRYKKTIHLSNTKDTKIVVRYKTTVPCDDFTYSVRMQHPCKTYSLDFRIEGDTKYVMHTSAFGFCEDAINTPNDAHPNCVSVQFDDWIYRKDGIVVSFYPRPVNAPQP